MPENSLFKPMSGKELDRLLYEFDVPQTTLATSWKLGERTVRRWVAGTARIPAPIAALLRLCATNKQLRKKVGL
jgi:hypothetical protein